MPEVREEEIYEALLRFRGEKKVVIGKAEALLSLTPQDTHKHDRPDSILWVDILLRLFGQELKLRIPIPVEGEKNSIDDAMEDLDEFVKRKRYPIEIPMLVITEAGYAKREEHRDFPTRFMMTQFPVRRLKEE